MQEEQLRRDKPPLRTPTPLSELQRTRNPTMVRSYKQIINRTISHRQFSYRQIIKAVALILGNQHKLWLTIDKIIRPKLYMPTISF